MVSHETYWSTITDCNGTVEQELSYDSWGNRRDPDTWRRNWYNSALEEPMFDRGYTGHEHMTAFGLINMNGRCYDPVMSSFLSVDAYVQSPDNSQNFNRYAYCLNNPLKYTDPSGWTVIGGSMGSHTTGAVEWGTNYAPVYEPRDLYSPFARGEAAMALLTSYRVGNCFIPVFLEGGGGGCSNSGEGDGDDKYVFGYGTPNAVKVMGPGACVFASLGEICKRLGKMNMKPKNWKDKEVEYYNMKNAGSKEDENNHGYNPNNLVDFVQWVGESEGVNISIQQISMEGIPQAHNDKAQVLVASTLSLLSLVEKNDGELGHAAVLNSYLIRNDNSIVMTFGDPSPNAIMPVYRQNNKYGAPPDGFSSWGFYQINISLP